nr:hypothetical protein [Tanacetum cinerariifolium]
IPRTPEDGEDDGNGEEDQGLRISEEEKMHEEEEADELYRDVDINQGRGLQVSQDIEDSHMTLTLTHFDGQQESSSTSSFVTNLLNSIIDPVFRFEDRVKSLEVNFSEFMRTNQSTEAVSNIPGLVHQYMHQEMTEAIREAVQTQTDRLQDSIQRENDEFLINIDDNMKKIIKEQALVEAYDADKTILDTYGESAILKRRRKEDDDQEGPSAGSDRGSKRRREGGEHASANTPSEPAIESASRSTTGNQSRRCLLPRKPPTPDRDWNKSLPAAQGNAQSWISALAKQTDACSSFNELLDTPIDFSNFIMNRLSIDTLTPELLAGPTYEFMRGSCNSLTELKFGGSLQSDDRSVGLGQPRRSTRREAYTAYSNPRGFIYQNRDKKNRLMRIDKLHKFIDGTLNGVRNALDDRLKEIRMQYFLTTIWRKGDKDRAAAMIQAIDKMLKTRRIMRSLERFVGGRQYEGDF